MLECVAFLLVRDGEVLAERRRLTKKLLPGICAIPGGHLEAGEAPEAGLRRELHEELGLNAREVQYVCSLLHRSEELRRLHYYAIETWSGAMENNEAEALLWIPLNRADELNLDVDRTAVAEYVRLYG